MSLPLLSSQELSSPSMFGAISGKTADMMADAGSALSKQIELNSTKAEAQAKAPDITNLYSTAYQKIAAGDFTGFSEMQKARSMAIGNPILMKTMDDADALAGHLAGQYMQITKTADTEKDIAARQLKSQEFQVQKARDLQDSQNTRMSEMEASRERRSDERAGTQVYIQDHSSWEKENLQAQKDYESQTKLWQKRQDAENQSAALEGRTPNDIPKPDKPSVRREPRPEDYKINTAPASAASLPAGGAADQSLPLMNANDHLLATPPVATPAASAPDPLVGMTLTDLNSDQPKVNPHQHTNSMPVGSDQMGAKPTNLDNALPQAAHEGKPLVNENAVQLGNIKFHIGKELPDVSEVTTNSETGAVEKKYKFSGDEKKLASSINYINETSPRFAQFIANAQRAGEKVELVPVGNPDKAGNQVFHAKAGADILTDVNRDDQGNPIRDPQGNLQRIPVPLQKTGKKDSPGPVDAWEQAVSVIGPLQAKGIVNVERMKLTGDDADSARNHALVDAAAKPDDLGKINAQLKSYDIEPLTPDEVKAKQTETVEAAKAPLEKAKADQKNQHADAILQQMGVLPKTSTPLVGDGKGQAEVHDLEVKFRNLHNEIKSLGIADTPEKSAYAKKKALELIDLGNEIARKKSSIGFPWTLHPILGNQ